MKKQFIFLVLSVIFSAVLFPAMTYAAEERIPTSIDIHTTSAWGVERFAPNHGPLHLNARLLDQHGDFFSFGPWIFQLSGYAEGDHLIPGWLSPNLYIGPDKSPRTIAIKVILLGTPSIYATLDVVVDPYVKNIRFESSEGELHRGAPGTISFCFTAPNIPDGLYPATITNRFPLSLPQLPDGVTAEGFEAGWCEQRGFAPAEGYVLIENNAGTIVFAFDETVTGDYFTWALPDEFPWYVPDREQNFLSLDLWIYVDDLEFRESFILNVFNDIAEIFLAFEGEYAQAPGAIAPVYFDLRTAEGTFIRYGYHEIIWTVNSPVESDHIYYIYWTRIHFSIGPEPLERTVTITAALAEDPSIYASTTINVDPSVPLMAYMMWLESHDTVSSDGAAAIIALVMNEVGHIMPNTLLSWEMFGYAEGDELVIYPWGAVFYAGPDEEEREVIIQAHITDQPYLTDTVSIAVTGIQPDFVPAFGEFSEDFHLPVTIPSIPDGVYHALLMLSSGIIAAYTLEYFDYYYWGSIHIVEVAFTNGAGSIKFLIDDDLEAGTLIGWFSLYLPVYMQGYAVTGVVIYY